MLERPNRYEIHPVVPLKTVGRQNKEYNRPNETRNLLAARAEVSTHKVDQVRAVKRHDEEHGTTLLKAVKEGEMDLRTAAAAAAAKSAANAFGVMSIKTARLLEGAFLRRSRERCKKGIARRI